MIGTRIAPPVDSILMFVLASRDTTASALTFVVYLLAMHPRVMTRLRQEILDKAGPIRMPNENDIKDMKYLRAVINGMYSRAKNLAMT
jgi:cytochrome P450